MICTYIYIYTYVYKLSVFKSLSLFQFSNLQSWSPRMPSWEEIMPSSLNWARSRLSWPFQDHLLWIEPSRVARVQPKHGVDGKTEGNRRKYQQSLDVP